MPSIRDLKTRITSVKNTQQTTKAMKMVSAAKLRRAQDAITAQRPYAREIGRLIRGLSAATEIKDEQAAKWFASPGEDTSGQRLLLVVVTSDRGLCGGFNGNVIRATQRYLAAEGAKFASVELAFVGKKAFDIFKTRGVKIRENFTEAGGKVTIVKAKKVAERLVELFDQGEFDRIKIIFNEFKNAITQKVTMDDFLPLAAAPTAAGTGPETDLANVILKPSGEVLLEKLVKKNFVTQVYRVMLENQAGEHGARMSAMESATKNAGEMIRKLTLQYNKQRQAGITKELLEIISGSESQKSA